MEDDRIRILKKVASGEISPEDAEKALRVLDREFLGDRSFQHLDSLIQDVSEFVTADFYAEIKALEQNELTFSLVKELIVKHVNPSISRVLRD